MMPPEKIIQAARACADIIRHNWGLNETKPEPMRLANHSLFRMQFTARERDGHLLFMTQEIERIVSDAVGPEPVLKTFSEEELVHTRNVYASKREKAMRWLGFLQGTLWALDYATIEDLKKQNMPETPDPRETAAALGFVPLERKPE